MNEPPLPLRDDPSVSADLRAALSSASSAALTDYDVTAGLARFEGTLAAPAPPAPAAPVAAAKLLLAPALGGAIAGLAVVAALSALTPSPPSVPVANTVSRTAVSAAPPPAQPPIPPAPEPRPADKAPPAPAPAPPRAASARTSPPDTAPPDTAPPDTASPHSTPPPAPPRAGPDALALEMDHLARLRAAERSDPAAALALAAEGQRLFPSGVFSQEREFIAIGALTQLGRAAEARARAQAFLAAHPESAFAERVRRLTGVNR